MTLGEDDVEAAARSTYRRMIEQAIGVARTVAGDGRDTDRCPWPAQAAPPCVSAKWRRRRTKLTSADALARGWLAEQASGCQDERLGSVARPLSGLSVVIKDVIDVARLPTRNGTPGGLWRTPSASASAWRLLDRAGATCVGKSATHEMAWGVTTPQIGNPIDEEHIAGGSSGGSAACVAAGVCQGALGTDTSGSIRIPAALCGVVGIRPTHGRVDMTGITPLAPTQDVVGPLASDVASCAAMLEQLLDRPLWRGVHTLSGARIAVPADWGAVDDVTHRAMELARAALEAAGVVLVRCDTDLPRVSGAISLLTMLQESSALYASVVRSDPAAFGSEARVQLTVGTELDAQADLIGIARSEVRARTRELFVRNDLDAVLTPTTACVAPRRNATHAVVRGGRRPLAAALTQFSAWAPVTGLPAISVPVVLTRLPAAAQVMARPDREDICVAAGAVVSGACGHSH